MDSVDGPNNSFLFFLPWITSYNGAGFKTREKGASIVIRGRRLRELSLLSIRFTRPRTVNERPSSPSKFRRHFGGSLIKSIITKDGKKFAKSMTCPRGFQINEPRYRTIDYLITKAPLLINPYTVYRILYFVFKIKLIFFLYSVMLFYYNLLKSWKGCECSYEHVCHYLFPPISIFFKQYTSLSLSLPLLRFSILFLPRAIEIKKNILIFHPDRTRQSGTGNGSIAFDEIACNRTTE